MVKRVEDFILSFDTLGKNLFDAAQKVREVNTTPQQLICCAALERVRERIDLLVVDLKVRRRLKAAVFDYAVGRKDMYDEIDEFEVRSQRRERRE